MGSPNEKAPSPDPQQKPEPEEIEEEDDGPLPGFADTEAKNPTDVIVPFLDRGTEREAQYLERLELGKRLAKGEGPLPDYLKPGAPMPPPEAEWTKCLACGKVIKKLRSDTRFCKLPASCRSNWNYRERRDKKRLKRAGGQGHQVLITQNVLKDEDAPRAAPTRVLNMKRREPKHVGKDLIVPDFPVLKKDQNPPEAIQLNFDYHPKQEIASMAVEAGARIVFFLAGVRSGKTVWLVKEIIKQPYVYDSIPNIAYLVSPTNGMMANVRSLFANAAEGAMVDQKVTSSSGPAHFILKPSPSIPDRYFVVEMHSGDNPNRMRGRTICAAGLDEVQEMKPEVFDVIKGRVMEADGIILMAGTATFPGHWTKTDVIDRAYRCGKCNACVYDHYDLATGPDGSPERDASGRETRRYVPKDHDPVDCYGDPRIAVIVCSSFDNTFLDAKLVEQLRADYAKKDPIIARREVYAEYLGFEGLCYSRFDRQLHKSPYNVYNVPADAYIACGLDFGANDPTACAIMARVGDTWHLIGEYCDDDRAKAISDHVVGIKKACGPVWNRVKKWWYDPSGRIVAMEMARQGIRPMIQARKRKSHGESWKKWRIGIINSLILSQDEKGRPLFLVNPSCKAGIENLENKKWKRYVSKGEDGRERVIDLTGKEVDRNPGDDVAPGHDHVLDGIEYCITSEHVHGFYKVKDKKAKVIEGEVEKSAAVNHSIESQNVSRAIASNITSVIQSMRRPGRVRPGW